MKGKKRVQEVVTQFAKMNSRIHGKIKLCSLASTIGIDAEHLDRLMTDPAAVQLGFNTDASLKLMVEESQHVSSSLRLSKADPLERTQGVKQIERRFAVGQWLDSSRTGIARQNVLLEYRDYEPDISNPGCFDPRTAGRIENLTKLLKQHKEQVFRIPRCVWWTFEKNQIILAFETAKTLSQDPMSLRSLLPRDPKLSLNNKAKLALGLAKCLANLQMVKLVRERSPI